MKAFSPLCTRFPLAAFVASVAAVPAISQCQLSWQEGPKPGGVAGTGYTLTSLASGDLLVCGGFEVAGDVIANGVARFDGSSFSALGSGVQGTVFAATTLPNGDVIVAGSFGAAGGINASNIARWDGVSWTSLGSGTNGGVRSLAVLPSGALVAAGSFVFAGGVACNGIARWDGTSWSELGGGPSMIRVDTVAVDASGLLYAGGVDPQGQHVQRWDGVAWSSLPGVAPLDFEPPSTMLFRANGDLVLLGNNASTLGQIWNAGGVSSLQLPEPGLGSLAEAPNGDLLVGKAALSPASSALLQFDGTTWTSIGGFLGSLNAFAADGSGRLFAAGRHFGGFGGVYEIVGGTSIQPLASVVPVVDARVVQALPSGDVVVAGSFGEIEGVAANNIALWDGASYQPLGQGVDGRVTAMTLDAAGDLLVGGEFLNAGGIAATRIARWDGSSWSAIGGGVNGIPMHLAANRFGEILEVQSNPTGNFLRYYDGQVWQAVTLGTGMVRDVQALPDGDFIIGGMFLPATFSGGYRFSAGVVTPLSSPGFRVIEAMDLAPNGDLLIAQTGITSGVVRETANGPALIAPFSVSRDVSDLEMLPDGSLVIVSDGVERLVGSSWVPIDGGIGANAVRDVAFGARGELFAVGRFQVAGTSVAAGVTRATTGCPASVQSSGAVCVGSAGPVVLSTSDRPWLFSTLEASATGMTATSLAAQVLGLQPTSLPLPLGAAGCALLVDPAVVSLLLPEAGVASVALNVPSGAGTLGQSLLLQVVGLELGPQSGLQQTTSSNALSLTIGAF
ncbi:MAG: hypothetical protein AB8H80_00630 [Planctomycetota bacterium]